MVSYSYNEKILKVVITMSFRPLSRIGWGPTWVFDCEGIEIEEVFPAPVEAWVVSYPVTLAI